MIGMAHPKANAHNERNMGRPNPLAQSPHPETFCTATVLCFKSNTRSGVMASKSEEYRARALDAETRALEVDDLDLKRQFEEIAKEWFRMAELAARHGW